MIANAVAASRWWMSDESDRDFINRLVEFVGAAPSVLVRRAGCRFDADQAAKSQGQLQAFQGDH